MSSKKDFVSTEASRLPIKMPSSSRMSRSADNSPAKSLKCDDNSATNRPNISEPNLINLDESVAPVEKIQESRNATSNGVSQLSESVLRQVFLRMSRSDMLKCTVLSKQCMSIVRDIVASGPLEITYELLRDLEDTNKKIPGVDEALPTKGQNKDLINGDKDDKETDPQRLLALVNRFYPNASQLAVECGAKLDPYYLSNLLNLHKTLNRLTLCNQIDYKECYCKPRATTKFDQLETIEIGSMTTVSACWLLDIIIRSPHLTTVKVKCTFANPEHSESFLVRAFPGTIERIHWPMIKVCSEDQAVIDLLVKRNPGLDILDCPIKIVSNLCSQTQLRNITRLALRLNEIWHVTRENRPLISDIKYLCQLKNLECLELRTYEFCEDEEFSPESESRLINERESYKKIFWETLSKLPKLTALALFGSWEFNKTCHQVSKYLKNIELLKINLLPEDIKETIRENQTDSRSFNIEEGLNGLKRMENLRAIHIMCSELCSAIDRKSLERLRTDLLDKIWNFEFRIIMSPTIEELLLELNRRGLRIGRRYLVTFSIEPKEVKGQKHTFLKVDMHFGYGQQVLKSQSELHEEIDRIVVQHLASRGFKQGYSSIIMSNLSVVSMSDRRAFYDLAQSWNKYFGAFTIDKRYFI